MECSLSLMSLFGLLELVFIVTEFSIAILLFVMVMVSARHKMSVIAMEIITEQTAKIIRAMD